MKKLLGGPVPRYLFLTILAAIVGINLYNLNAARLAGNQLPMPFGYGAAVVLSGSMEPELSVNDLIIVKEADSYGINDIVVYQDGRSLVVHRIVSIDGESVITQGDANNTTDEPIHISAIKGTVVYWIPFVGEIIGLVKSPMGTVGILAAAILLIEIPRRREKKKDEAQKQKIIDEINCLKAQD